MIDWLRRAIRPGRYRKADTDAIVHGMRNQAQVAQLQTHIFQRRREREEAERTGHFWVDRLRGLGGSE